MNDKKEYIVFYEVDCGDTAYNDNIIIKAASVEEAESIIEREHGHYVTHAREWC